MQPFDTAYGRKTRIDQTTCNLDFSCIDGDCPSFVTVDTGATRWRRPRRNQGRGENSAATDRATALAALLSSTPPAPTLTVDPDDVTIRMVGIGGTGVVTVAQVLGTAAMLDGYQVRGLDQIGLSQKAGPVVSDLHLTRGHDSESSRLGAGQADVLLVFDALVAASKLGVGPSDRRRTLVVGSTSATPPGAAITDPTLDLPSFEDLDAVLQKVTRPDHRAWIDADAVTTLAFGDALTANILVAGMALQSGALPIDPEAVELAIELNGTAAEKNRDALRLGRHLVADRAAVERVLTKQPVTGTDRTVLPSRLQQRVDALGLDADGKESVGVLAADLVQYQDENYASEYLDTVEHTRRREQSVAPESSALTLTVARSLHRLMAYKDEYDVARLLLDEDARDDINRIGTGRVRYHLHPPVLRSLGVSRKIALGTWFDPALRTLARGKRLRGTMFDPFRWPEVRRTERQLPGEYRAAIDQVLRHLDRASLVRAVAIAELPDLVRGYEDLKLRRVAQFRSRLAREVAELAPARRQSDQGS